jgi:putative transposase
MTTTRKRYSAKFKARVALEAICGEKPLNQLGSQFQVHPVQIAHWRKAALGQLQESFVDGRTRKAGDDEFDCEALQEQIGRLKLELEWVKKKLVCSDEDRRSWVEPEHPAISILRQCALLGVSRASLCYDLVEESRENLGLLKLIDEQYTQTPFYGSSRMTPWLQSEGYGVNRKRVARQMRVMGIEAVYAKPKLSPPGEGHKIYPYLLKRLKIERRDQVWCTDITDIPMAQGFVYLVAVMDWFSQFVLSCALSLTMELEFCLEALWGALRKSRPEIFNSDQGSQFTRERFLGELERRNIAIRMDGRGRCLGNIFIERLWRSLKYEELYLKDYQLV